MNNHKPVWWESPHRLVLFFILPTYLLVSYTLQASNKSLKTLYFSPYFFYFGVIFLLLIFLFSALTSKIDLLSSLEKQKPLSPIFLDIIFYLTLIGYILFLKDVLANFEMLIKALKGTITIYELSTLKNRIPGLTTFTQFGITYFNLFFLYKLENKNLNLITQTKYSVYLIIILIFALIRSFVATERLALIELVIPLSFFIFRYFNFINKFLTRFIISTLPFFGIILMYLLFTISEVRRSWSYYQYFYNNIFEFTLERFSLYYSTALNNGAMIVTKYGDLDSSPFFTFDWLIKLPILGEYALKFIPRTFNYKYALEKYLNPEFNNPSGIFPPLYEFGWFALIIPTIIGIVSGYCYKCWNRGAGFGFLLYPICIVSILEIIRTSYLNSNRTVPAIIALAIVWILNNFKDRIYFKRN